MLIRKSSNFVPSEIMSQNRLRKRMSQIAKGLRILIGVFVFAIACEASFFFVASEMKVPPPLEAEHVQATREMAGIKHEITTIELAKKEDQYPMRALKGVILNKPNDVRFNKIDIGQNDVKKINTEWIRLEVISSNPLSINEFVTRLGMDTETFNGANINRITSNTSNGMKVANVIAGKK